MMKIEQNKYIHKDMQNNMARQQKYGIISGCGVTADSPASMGVIIASGTYLFNGVKVITAGDTVTLDTADASYNRYDSIVLDNAGNLSAVKGTLSLNDDDPALTGVLPINDYNPDTYIPIARIFVGKGVSTITASDIKDLIINAGFFNFIETNEISGNLDTSSESITDADGSETNLNASLWILQNVGADNIYLNFGAVATTNNFYLKPDENITLNLDKTVLHYICDTSLTSTLSIISGTASNNIYNNFLSISVSIANTSTQIYDSTNNYKEWLIINDGTEDVFIKFGTVATVNDYKLKAGETLAIKYEINKLYAITTSSTATVRVFALRV